MSRELLKRAVRFMSVVGCSNDGICELCDEIEAYLSQPKPEPVAWLSDRGTIWHDKQDAVDDSDGFVEPLYTTPTDQSARIAELTKRLRIAEDVIRTSKLTSDCKTADDWKCKAEWYEYNWRTCSEGFNAMASDLKSQLAALQSKRERLSDSRIVEVMGDRFPVETIAFYEGFRAAEEAHGIGA